MSQSSPYLKQYSAEAAPHDGRSIRRPLNGGYRGGGNDVAKKGGSPRSPRPAVTSERLSVSNTQILQTFSLKGLAGSSLVGGLVLLLGMLLLNGPHLNGLEFFRHTEADRALISYEMLKRNDFVVPHLLGSPILTKPPLFYWLVSLSLYLTEGLTEWSARLPSLLVAAMFVLGQLLFVRRALKSPTDLSADSWKLGVSLLAAAMLASSALFCQLAVQAEIDMTFGCLCFLCYASLYLAIAERNHVALLSVYVTLALAVLTKGLPIVPFVLATGYLFSIWCSKLERNTVDRNRRTLAHAVGLLLFFGILGTWVLPLATAVGWSELLAVTKRELLTRVYPPVERNRGFLFYLESLLPALLPWSLFLFGGAAVALQKWLQEKPLVLNSSAALRSFTAFHLIALAVGIVGLSLVPGKATRYLFPIYGILSNCCLLGLIELQRTKLLRQLQLLGIIFCSLILLCSAAVIVFLEFPRLLPTFLGSDLVSSYNLQLAICSIAAGAVTLLGALLAKRGRATILALLLLVFSVRVAELAVFVPLRNSTRSVKPLAATLNEIVPPGDTIYTIELFERWVVFALTQQGRTTERLSPQQLPQLIAKGSPIFLLLQSSEEQWRLEQLGITPKSPEILYTSQGLPERLLLIKIAPDRLANLTLKKEFPTFPSNHLSSFTPNPNNNWYNLPPALSMQADSETFAVLSTLRDIKTATANSRTHARVAKLVDAQDLKS